MTTEDNIRSDLLGEGRRDREREKEGERERERERERRSKGEREGERQYGRRGRGRGLKHSLMAGPTAYMILNFRPCQLLQHHMYIPPFLRSFLLLLHLNDYSKTVCHYRIAPVCITSLR